MLLVFSIIQRFESVKLGQTSRWRQDDIYFPKAGVASDGRYVTVAWLPSTLQWRHNDNEGDGVSNHQPHDCLLKRLIKRRSKKHHSSASLAFVGGIHRWLVNSPHKGPVTRKMFPFDDVILLHISVIFIRFHRFDGCSWKYTCIVILSTLCK